MDIKKMIQAIQKCHERPVQHYFIGEMPGFNIEVALRDCDKLACEIIHLMVVGEKNLDFNIHDLEKISYLSEPLKVIEEDESLSIIRSFPPVNIKNDIRYFQISVAKHTLRMSRYEFEKDTGSRVAIVEPLTKNIITRLVEDFVDIVCK